MGALNGLFVDGRAADIVLLVMAAELALLLVAGRAPRAALAAILPGALIVLALRAALVGADWRWVALPLAGALPLHLADLCNRGWFAGFSLRQLRAAEKAGSSRVGSAPDSGRGWRRR